MKIKKMFPTQAFMVNFTALEELLSSDPFQKEVYENEDGTPKRYIWKAKSDHGRIEFRMPADIYNLLFSPGQKKEVKEGDILTVRRWEDMEKEFGINEKGNILCSLRFVDSMRKFCGKEVTIDSVEGESNYRIKEDNRRYEWSNDMFEETCKQREKEDLQIDNMPITPFYTCLLHKIIQKGARVIETYDVYPINDANWQDISSRIRARHSWCSTVDEWCEKLFKEEEKIKRKIEEEREKIRKEIEKEIKEKIKEQIEKL